MHYEVVVVPVGNDLKGSVVFVLRLNSIKVFFERIGRAFRNLATRLITLFASETAGYCLMESTFSLSIMQ
ncbi:MAG: hypothetical protein AAGG69_05635 [Pseudomonadota bacterium]